ncbi:MAG: hypothetical protein AABX98_05255, partial [Nanoarchaeota archaeon]
MPNTIDTAIEKIFAQSKTRHPTSTSDGFDVKSVRYTTVQELPSGLLAVRRVAEDEDLAIGQRRSDIITYDQQTGSSAVLLQDAVYVPEPMKQFLERDGGRYTFGSLQDLTFLTDRLAAAVTVVLFCAVKVWTPVF